MVVSLCEIIAPNGRTAHPHGSVGVVIRAPSDGSHSYRIRFADGGEESLRRDEVVMLARYQAGEIGDPAVPGRDDELYDRILYRCVIGSRAYGLDDERSDIDYRGVVLTGIHLMRSGRVEANLLRLNEDAKLPYIDELVAVKTSGTEKERLNDADCEFHRREYERLLADLEAAYQRSPLPESPGGERALNDLLVRLRLGR